MSRLILFVALLLGVGLLAAAHEPEAENKKALRAFVGTWEIVTVKPAGATKSARRLVFNKDGSYAAQDRDGKELWAGTYEINPAVNPKVWDHRSRDARKEGKDVLGIYELEGDKLKVACVVGQWEGKKWVGKPRPKSMAPKEADVVIELKRVAPGK